MGFLKNGNSDDNLSLVNSLIFGYIIFSKNGSCLNKFIFFPCDLIIVLLTDKKSNLISNFSFLIFYPYFSFLIQSKDF